MNTKEYNKKYYAEHPELKERAKKRAMLPKVKKNNKKYSKEYKNLHPEKYKERIDKWNQKGKEYIKEFVIVLFVQ